MQKAYKGLRARGITLGMGGEGRNDQEVSKKYLNNSFIGKKEVSKKHKKTRNITTGVCLKRVISKSYVSNDKVYIC